MIPEIGIRNPCEEEKTGLAEAVNSLKDDQESLSERIKVLKDGVSDLQKDEKDASERLSTAKEEAQLRSVTGMPA